jgi:hypothetical protein
MARQDEKHCELYDTTIKPLVSTLEKTKIADKKGNLKEADPKLVDGTACVVDSSICDEILLGAHLDGEA